FRLFIAHLRLDKTPNLGVHQTGSSSVYLPGVLPGGPTAVRAKLEGQLGPLAELEVETAKTKDSSYAQAVLARGWSNFQDRFSALLRALHEIAEQDEEREAAIEPT
ncbi:hypothetical protein, partial [Bradyrhizobium denitrificans]|uniref:hypothetical protein n=1 Tax=Bradyrhizobium denitrificans TaxID=2734912 RepID=UPI0020237326